jgi:hypothetical protein
VDFLVKLDQEFDAIVMKNLSPFSNEVIVSRRQASTMTPAELKRVRKEVEHLVYGRNLIALLNFFI